MTETFVLAPAQLAVLRALARKDLSLAVSISQSLGRAVAADLAVLRERGFVKVFRASRNDGVPSYLHSISAEGREALRVCEANLAIASSSVDALHATPSSTPE